VYISVKQTDANMCRKSIALELSLPVCVADWLIVDVGGRVRVLVQQDMAIPAGMSVRAG
jgi:hypothetical protein